MRFFEVADESYFKIIGLSYISVAFSYKYVDHVNDVVIKLKENSVWYHSLRCRLPHDFGRFHKQLNF